MSAHSDGHQGDSAEVPAAGCEGAANTCLGASPAKVVIAEERLRAAVAAMHLSNDGDDNEKLYWPAINDGFPNYEEFWRWIVVPTTKRIESPPQPERRIERRDGIADDLWMITYVNYSLFLNLVGAFEHLSQPLTLSVGSFYTHLASACDLAEDFLLRVETCVAECRGRPLAFGPLTKEEFLQRQDEWYEKEYQKKYEHSHAKGKAMIVHVPPKNEVTRNCKAWGAFRKFAAPIRQYRNKIVHDVQIGTIRVGKINLIPKPEKISRYAVLAAVQAAVRDPESLKSDFVVREEQMFRDFCTFKACLNDLWEGPIQELRPLLYQEKNEALLAKYNLGAE
jgi:hypothetical protein